MTVTTASSQELEHHFMWVLPIHFSTVTELSYPTVESYLNIIPWLENMARPILLKQTLYSLAHISSKASSMAHPFLASHLKKCCWAFLEGSSLPASHHWRLNSTEWRLYAIIDAFITIFIIFLLINILIFGIILAQSTTKKSHRLARFWLCYYFLIRIQLTIQIEIESTLRSCNSEKLKEKKKERKKKVENPKPLRSEHAHIQLPKKANIT